MAEATVFEFKDFFLLLVNIREISFAVSAFFVAS